MAIVCLGVIAAAGCMASDSDGSSATDTTITTETTTIEPVTVTGTVRDPNLEEPIAGAIVSLGGEEVETDGNGEFEFDGVSSGQHDLTASKDGYATEELSFDVSEDRSVDIQLKNRLFYEPNETVLGSTHISGEDSCTTCHEAESAFEVTSDPSRDDCLGCHSAADVKKSTADLKHNPHSDPHGYSRKCSSCHKVHTVSVDSCAECHPDEWIPQPP